MNSENAKIRAELEKINKMLEDERQKVEDLMFRNEEENINKEDYNVSNQFNKTLTVKLISIFNKNYFNRFRLVQQYRLYGT